MKRRLMRPYMNRIRRNADRVTIKKGILQFCGFEHVNRTLFSHVKHSTLDVQNKWLESAYQKIRDIYGC